MHAYIHTCMHAYIHTYMHTYIHTYTIMLKRKPDYIKRNILWEGARDPRGRRNAQLAGMAVTAGSTSGFDRLCNIMLYYLCYIILCYIISYALYVITCISLCRWKLIDHGCPVRFGRFPFPVLPFAASPFWCYARCTMVPAFRFAALDRTQNKVYMI